MDAYSFELTVSAGQSASGKSSLLIPDRQLGYYQQRCAQYGSRAAYFHCIVASYLALLPLLQDQLNSRRDPNWKTTYQASGQSLLKKNFIPDSNDWELFRNAAIACGVSMCFLFVFLMRLEAEGFFENFLKKGPIGRNSSPESPESEGKLEKFSILWRILDEEGQKLIRKHRKQ